MSRIDMGREDSVKIEIIGHLDLPIFWKEKVDYENCEHEKPF
jgi:hypothetical protein